MFAMPIAQHISVKSRFPALLQLGHEPINRQAIGRPRPPTNPFERPYNFRIPSAVKGNPTLNKGKQIITLSIAASVDALTALDTFFPPND
jgi:hypothetical protein